MPCFFLLATLMQKLLARWLGWMWDRRRSLRGGAESQCVRLRISVVSLRLYDMICEVGAPRLAALNEGLHKCTLGLDGVHQIVGGPLMQ